MLGDPQTLAAGRKLALVSPVRRQDQRVDRAVGVAAGGPTQVPLSRQSNPRRCYLAGPSCRCMASSTVALNVGPVVLNPGVATSQLQG